MIENPLELLELIKTAGIVLGVPALIVIGVKLYNRQVSILKSQIEYLKETQYDKAFNQIKSQKELYEIEHKRLQDSIGVLEGQKGILEVERLALEKQIEDLETLVKEKDELLIETKEEIEKLRIRLESTKKSISAISNSIDVFEKLNFPRTVVNREAVFDQSTFRSVASFAECVFAASVIFSNSTFSGTVFFNDVTFSQGPVFDNAFMRNASFDGTDLRGVDLSKAIVDSETVLPSKWAVGKLLKNLTKKSSRR